MGKHSSFYTKILYREASLAHELFMNTDTVTLNVRHTRIIITIDCGKSTACGVKKYTN